eukprot:828035-Pelagomonas_calceolata.AAC.9
MAASLLTETGHLSKPKGGKGEGQNGRLVVVNSCTSPHAACADREDLRFQYKFAEHQGQHPRKTDTPGSDLHWAALEDLLKHIHFQRTYAGGQQQHTCQSQHEAVR